MYTYNLVTGTGSTDNASFNISGSTRNEDIEAAAAMTIIGTAGALNGIQREAAAATIIDKLPALGGYVASPECALVRIVVAKCLLVTHFQNVTEYVPG